MSQRPIPTFFFCGLLLTTAACTTRFVDFTLLSTKNIDLSRASTFHKERTRTEGVDRTHIIIFIPTGVPNLKEAIDRAIEAVPGAVGLLDGVVTHGFFYIPYIYGQAHFAVEGTPLIDPELALHSTFEAADLIAHVDEDGQLVGVRHVSKEEYDAVRQQVHASASVEH